MVERSDEPMSFDLKNVCNAIFIGSLLCILVDNFIRTELKLYSLGFLELLLQTILGRGIKIPTIQILSLRKRVLVLALSFSKSQVTLL